MSFPFKPVLLAVVVSQTFPAFAADPVPQVRQDLNEVKVIGGRKAQKLGEEKGNSRYLQRLFPDGPAKQATKLAGLPKPAKCL